MKKVNSAMAVIISFAIALCAMLAVFPVAAAPELVTFTVTLTDNADGTANLVATIPDGVKSGKIVIKPSASLEYIENSLTSDFASSAVNPNYNRDGVTGICVSFASATFLKTGDAAMRLSFNILNGAAVSADDISVPLWNLSNGDTQIASEKDGDAVKVYVPALSVTFKDWDGKVLHTAKVRSGSAAAAPAATPTRTGYSFKGWDKDFSSVTEDLVVNAMYDINTYTVKFVTDGHGSLEGKTELKADYGAELSSIPFPMVKRDGTHVFYRWSKTEGTVTENMEITAEFALIGDVTKDGSTDNIDASAILSFDSGSIDFDNFQLITGNVDFNDATDNLDAAILLKYDAGVISEF